MNFGPPTIVIPRGHKTPVLLDTILSINNFGMVLWSDGVAEGPHMPKEHPILKNVAEDRLFWVHEAEKLGSTLHAVRNEFDKLEKAIPASDTELLGSLAVGFADSVEKEWALRRYVWQRSNDPIRQDESATWSDQQRENVEAFVKLCDPDVPQVRMLMAEACRELGRFRDAEVLLDMEPPENMEEVIQELLRLARSHVSRVTKLREA